MKLPGAEVLLLDEYLAFPHLDMDIGPKLFIRAKVWISYPKNLFTWRKEYKMVKNSLKRACMADCWIIECPLWTSIEPPTCPLSTQQKKAAQTTRHWLSPQLTKETPLWRDFHEFSIVSSSSLVSWKISVNIAWLYCIQGLELENLSDSEKPSTLGYG